MAPFPSRLKAAVTFPPTPAHYSGTFPASPSPSSYSQTPSSSSSNLPARNRRVSPVPVHTHASYGTVELPSAGAILGGVGQSWESVETVQRLLQVAHDRQGPFSASDDQYYSNASQHTLSSFSLGASAKLVNDIFDFASRDSTPIPALQPIVITEGNWMEYLGEERLYSNFLLFFSKLIGSVSSSTSSHTGRQDRLAIVLNRYLFGEEESEMLTRSFSSTMSPLIRIGYGLEFQLDAVVAQGLSMCAVASNQPINLVLDRPLSPQSSPLLSSASTALKYLRRSLPTSILSHLPIDSASDSFIHTVSQLKRTAGARMPREGLSAYTIVERMLHDEQLAAGAACRADDPSRFETVLRDHSGRIKEWSDEWKFAGASDDDLDEEDSRQARARTRTIKVPKWEEIVEKTEELYWLATAIYASTSRPGYSQVKLDFASAQCLIAVLFLPKILEIASPHLRADLVSSFFKILLTTWISIGRPHLYISETLMSNETMPSTAGSCLTSRTLDAANLKDRTAKLLLETEGNDDDSDRYGAHDPMTPAATRISTQSPPLQEQFVDQGATNPWTSIINAASDFPHDARVPQVIRSLLFAASHFGRSPPGLFVSSLPGTDLMDGSIFLRAARLTLSGSRASATRSVIGKRMDIPIGFDESWIDVPLSDIPSSTSSSSLNRSYTIKTRRPASLYSGKGPAQRRGTAEIVVDLQQEAVTDAWHGPDLISIVHKGDQREREREMAIRRELEEAQEEERELMA